MDAVRWTGPLLAVAFVVGLVVAVALLVVGFGVLVFNLGGAMVLDAPPEAGGDGS